MVKILFIHSQLVCGGAEQALFDLLSLMDKTKFEITVMVQFEGGVWEDKFRKAGFEVISPWSGQKQSMNPLVKIGNLCKRKRIEHALKNAGEGLLGVCQHKQFDIIVSYGLWFMQQMCFWGNAKTVKYIHGNIATNPQFCENILATLNLVKQFDRIICVSEMAKQSFEQITGITKGVTLHFNPLNSVHVSRMAEQEVLLPGGGPIVCAVGRLAKEKGYDRLIRIHKNLVDDGYIHKLMIVGDGPEKEKLLEVIEEVAAGDSVILVGYQSNPYPYMKHSKFLVCSSYTEGLPVIAMEALSLGIPIVSSAPSVGEAFGNELCGIITDVSDESLEAGIRKMLTDDEFYIKAKAGAEKRSAFFDGKRMVREIEEEFIALANSAD